MIAMILAAGLGTRMRPLTDELPKPLLRAGSDSLIGHLITGLAQAGYRQLVINHAWKGQRLEDELGDGTSRGVSIRYSRESDALETAGGIRQALPLLDEGNDTPFLVVNGDIWTRFPFQTLQERALKMGSHRAHLVLVPNPEHNESGDFHLDDHGTVFDSGPSRLTFAGIGLYRPSLFARVPSGIYPLAPVLRKAMAQKQVTGERYNGPWLDIGTPDRLEALDRELNEGRL